MNAKLLDDLFAANSSVDAAGLLALASVPTYTPRTDPVTLVFLSRSDIWGFAKACVQAALTLVASGSDAMAAAQARTFLSILTGTGFTATDPQVAALVPAFVAMGGGTVNADDATLALNTAGYPAGFPLPVLADCQSSIDRVMLQATRTDPIQALRTANNDRYNGNAAKLDAMLADSALAIPADLAALDAMVV